ncbi:MAG: HIRAN domain-containing protein [Marinifilaceae bacterium]
MKAIKSIYLSWRKGKGYSRSLVGRIQKNATKGVSFKYDDFEVEKARKDGFTPYVDFPDLSKEYSNGVIEAFGQRLVKTERLDKQKYHDFWEIEKKYEEDKYYMLAYTQGLLSTDNFEFLADFNPVKSLCFISEVCGLSSRDLPAGSLSIGDELLYELEPTNEYDSFAVKVYMGKDEIGYIKRIHSKVFHEKNNGYKLKLSVKGIEQNANINRIFIKISY